MAKDFPTIKLREMIVDNTCMQLASHPEQFDVMVCLKLPYCVPPSHPKSMQHLIRQLRYNGGRR